MEISYIGIRQAGNTYLVKKVRFGSAPDNYVTAIQVLQPTIEQTGGYDWGNTGHGAHNLADRLLGTVVRNQKPEASMRRDFLNGVVARLPHKEFEITQEEIRRWVSGWFSRHK